MLRSLVGSEMCIRDRVSTQSTGRSGIRNADHNAAACGAWPGCATHVRGDRGGPAGGGHDERPGGGGFPGGAEPGAHGGEARQRALRSGGAAPRHRGAGRGEDATRG
eukprot:TRINITY_DN1824_c0_g1_i4.p1 TRINITY_DN1824_c0_g1~~TRINITY_DN1824_c0_g1_i4.p1  ORF type:complete len:121 (+),score=26.40 TRINITY_DN1824_c0_g1_i4:45-365(+)